MIVDGVLILYTSNPKWSQMLVLSRLLGREVYLKPLTQLERKPKVAIAPEVAEILLLVHPN
jgi:hypothetical protein